jgi:hypothetical protein
MMEKQTDKELEDEIEDLDNQLYFLNSQIISLKWIGLKQIPTNNEIENLNEFLANKIKQVRKIKALIKQSQKGMIKIEYVNKMMDDFEKDKTNAIKTEDIINEEIVISDYIKWDDFRKLKQSLKDLGEKR